MTALVVGAPGNATPRSKLVRIKYENSTRYEYMINHQLEAPLPTEDQYAALGGSYVKPEGDFLMAEAQPSKKRGGHAYGRRVKQLSNTAEEGELCLYTGHSLGSFSTHSMRYDSHQACVRCVAGAREGQDVL